MAAMALVTAPYFDPCMRPPRGPSLGTGLCGPSPTCGGVCLQSRSPPSGPRVLPPPCYHSLSRSVPAAGLGPAPGRWVAAPASPARGWGLPSLEAAGPRGSRGAAGRAGGEPSSGRAMRLARRRGNTRRPSLAGVLADRGGACTAHARAAGGTRVQMAPQPRERTPGARALHGMAPPGHGPRRLRRAPSRRPQGAGARGPQPLSEPSQTPAPQGLLHDPCDPPLPPPGPGGDPGPPRPPGGAGAGRRPPSLSGTMALGQRADPTRRAAWGAPESRAGPSGRTWGWRRSTVATSGARTQSRTCATAGGPPPAWCRPRAPRGP